MMIPEVRGLVCCQGADDLLATTLPNNLPHLTELLVVTHPNDAATQHLCRSLYRGGKVRCFVTDERRRGDVVESGLTMLGRTGWILIWDAGILFPDAMPLCPQLGNFYEPLCEGPVPAAGYFQLFHAADQRLRRRPWYGRRNKDCAAAFANLWPHKHRLRPRFTVTNLRTTT